MRRLGWFLQTRYLIIRTTKVWLFLQFVECWFITLLCSPPLLHFLRTQKNPESINTRDGKQELRKPITQVLLERSCIWIQTLQTLSSLLCQLSSLFTMRSIQWDSVAKIPAVVALNVMASPLKSMPLIPLGVRDWSTAQKEGDADENKCSLCWKEQCSLFYSHQWVSEPERLLRQSTLPSTVYLTTLKGAENVSETMKL